MSTRTVVAHENLLGRVLVDGGQADLAASFHLEDPPDRRRQQLRVRAQRRRRRVAPETADEREHVRVVVRWADQAAAFEDADGRELASAVADGRRVAEHVRDDPGRASPGSGAPARLRSPSAAAASASQHSAPQLDVAARPRARRGSRPERALAVLMEQAGDHLGRHVHDDSSKVIVVRTPRSSLIDVLALAASSAIPPSASCAHSEGSTPPAASGTTPVRARARGTGLPLGC